MRDWLSTNLDARVHIDEIHETARLKAEARAIAESRKASQQYESQIQYHVAQERLKALSPPGLWT